ncbi:MAG: putative chitinase [Caudoviricetes sp.]|nr:MAG: putative chitinase [Caudoviricetes sp.]
MTPETLSEAMGIPLVRARKWAPALSKAMEGGQINTRLRIAAFLAQIGHESGSLVYVKELGGASYFQKYEGRKDLGNTQPGDGPKFAGRGLIQVTGRANYLAASKALFGDDRLLKTPESLEQPEWAAESAVWFWSSRNLNALADTDRFTDLTKRINGGTNGLEDRKARYRQALKVLG